MRHHVQAFVWAGIVSYSLVQKVILFVLKWQCFAIRFLTKSVTDTPLMRYYSNIQAELIHVLIIPVSYFLTVFLSPLIRMT